MFLCRQNVSIHRATLRNMLQRVGIALPQNELELIFQFVKMDALGKVKLERILPMHLFASGIADVGNNDPASAQPQQSPSRRGENNTAAEERNEVRADILNTIATACYSIDRRYA
jgi:hypothetical protein